MQNLERLRNKLLEILQEQQKSSIIIDPVGVCLLFKISYGEALWLLDRLKQQGEGHFVDAFFHPCVAQALFEKKYEYKYEIPERPWQCRRCKTTIVSAAQLQKEILFKFTPVSPNVDL